MLKRKIDPNKLIWKSKYNIGDYKTDLEHQSLFKVAKKALQIRTMQNDEKEIQELKDVIKSLYTYVATHFKNEEIYMESIDYPELSRHKIVHKELLKTLHEFVKTLNNLTIDEIEVSLYSFIENYFITHIVDEDMIIGTWKRSLKELRHIGSWQAKYITGVDFIDEEHQKIFELLDEAFMEVDDEHREEKIKSVLTHLYNFMKEYFKKEEKYLKEINFPEFDHHQKLHREFTKACNELLIHINDTNNKLFEKELAQFIDEHLVDHMMNEDKKISDFVNSKK
ncbi:MAG: hemerythrin domain-containing protein [Campylobacterota bacterium]|nr:hemerythrin domain-containing protein [Campylobacterota bacterium]